MQLIQYTCTHCRHQFEAEPREPMECPSCFWSSSVKPSDEVASSKNILEINGTPKNKSSFFSALGAFFTILMKVAIVLVLFVLFLFLGWKAYQWFQGHSALSSPNAKPFYISLDDSNKLVNKAKKSSSANTQNTEVAQKSISEEDQNVLIRRISLQTNRSVSEDEKKILNARVPFQTGLVERIPSQAWALDSFKARLEEQENIYKVPLPKNYKKKLEALFETHYLPAVDAFTRGDLLQARNGWVDSLNYPMYSEDVLKHRGVALTMLRPFTNDTLSKIGALNGILVDQGVRAEEASLNQGYMQLIAATQEKSWAKALSIITDLENNIQRIEKSAAKKGSLPEYPPSLALIDESIRRALLDLYSASGPSITDLQPIRQDILEKKRVIQGFLTASLDEQQAYYNEALDYIGHKEWPKAVKMLAQIQYPLALVQDAREKIKVIHKNKLEGDLR